MLNLILLCSFPVLEGVATDHQLFSAPHILRLCSWQKLDCTSKVFHILAQNYRPQILILILEPLRRILTLVGYCFSVRDSEFNLTFFTSDSLT
jgi:hypothetical protein